jgi:hypothetical protein
VINEEIFQPQRAQRTTEIRFFSSLPSVSSVSSVVKFLPSNNKLYLENEQDVENFVQNRKQRLLDELGDEIRLRIE